MRNAILIVLTLTAILAPVDLSAQQVRYLVIDGTQPSPTIIQTNLPNAARPTITRVGVGAYRLAFPFDVQFFNGDVQAGGGNHDASPMLFTSVFATNNLRVLQVRTYGLDPSNPMRAFPQNGRMSILVVR